MTLQHAADRRVANNRLELENGRWWNGKADVTGPPEAELRFGDQRLVALHPFYGSVDLLRFGHLAILRNPIPVVERPAKVCSNGQPGPTVCYAMFSNSALGPVRVSVFAEPLCGPRRENRKHDYD